MDFILSFVSNKMNKENSLETLQFNPFDFDGLLLDDNNNPGENFLMNKILQMQITIQPKKPN